MLVFGTQLTKRRSSRAAVVPYIIRPALTGGWRLWFLLGIHADSGDVSDFGGGVKKNEYDITGGYRELNEETKGIFKDTINTHDLTTCIAAVQDGHGRSRGMSVVFVPVISDWFNTAPILFAKANKKGNSHNEMSGLMWVCESDFLKLAHKPEAISNHIMWSRLRKFYTSIYTNELHNLLYVRYWWFMPKVEAESCIRQCDVMTL